MSDIPIKASTIHPYLGKVQYFFKQKSASNTFENNFLTFHLVFLHVSMPGTWILERGSLT